MQTDRKPLQVHLCYTTIQNKQRPKASLSPRSCLAYVWGYETDKLPLVTDIQKSNLSQHIVSTGNQLPPGYKKYEVPVYKTFLRRICGDFSFVWCMFIWVCLSSAGETEGVVLLCAVRSSVCLQLVEMMCTCAWVCLMRKYNRHVRAVNAQQTDILRSQCTAFCEGYLENTGRVQMRLISTDRSYQTRLVAPNVRGWLSFNLLVKNRHHIKCLTEAFYDHQGCIYY